MGVDTSILTVFAQGIAAAIAIGVAVPAECECPADVHRDPDCKHKVALAITGRPTVLNAALSYDGPSKDLEVATDGGCACDDDLPCFDCFDSGRRELPE
jgi:hypothetical protein